MTPDESTQDAEQPLGTYVSMSRSVESIGSISETIVRMKDKDKKRIVDVE